MAHVRLGCGLSNTHRRSLLQVLLRSVRKALMSSQRRGIDAALGASAPVTFAQYEIWS